MAIKKVTITKVFKNDKNKDGIAYVYKKGKNVGQSFTRVSLGAEGLEGLYSTCVPAGDRALALAEGQEVLLKFEEKDGFKNFSFPTKGEQQVYEDLTKTS